MYSDELRYIKQAHRLKKISCGISIGFGMEKCKYIFNWKEEKAKKTCLNGKNLQKVIVEQG